MQAFAVYAANALIGAAESFATAQLTVAEGHEA
jgi:hypothetical protein